MREQEDMGMISPGGRNLISQAEVIRMKQMQQLDDLFSGKPVFLRVVDYERPFSALRVIFIGLVYFSFLLLLLRSHW